MYTAIILKLLPSPSPTKYITLSDCCLLRFPDLLSVNCGINDLYGDSSTSSLQTSSASPVIKLTIITQFLN